MSKDEVFAGDQDRGSDFQFDASVAAVFDDMLTRSVPFYLEQQRLIQEIAAKFYQPGGITYDLGCSTATTLVGISRLIPDDAKLIGYDNSHPMIEKSKANVESVGLSDRIDIKYGDFNDALEELDMTDAGLVTLCWTLQFVRPLKRDRLIRRIYENLKPGGALIINEKVLTLDSNMNRFFIDFYYDFKRRNGYSEEEILQKREALENVLVPYRVDENMEMFKNAGFEIVETFFQWYNFVGFLCLKKG